MGEREEQGRVEIFSRRENVYTLLPTCYVDITHNVTWLTYCKSQSKRMIGMNSIFFPIILPDIGQTEQL